MIGGALGGLLIAVAYTLITGKLQLTKRRIVYGVPARVCAAAGLVPIAFLIVFLASTGSDATRPGGLGLFAAALAASVIVIYGAGWRYGEPPR